MTTSMQVQAILLAILAAIALAQPSPGIQLGNLSLGVDFRFPETVKQCEPVIIYCDTIRVGYSLHLLTPDNQVFLRIPIPNGTQYIEWICDVPAGYGFTASYYERAYFVVQPGSSSSCLHNITTTYSNGRYDTTVFESYTAHPPNTTVPLIEPLYSPSLTLPVPSESFPTLTVNPPFSVASTTPPSSTVSSSSTRLSKSKLAAIIFAAIALIIFFAVIFVPVPRRRRPAPSRDMVLPFNAPSKTGAHNSLQLSPRRPAPSFQPPWISSHPDRSDAASQTSRVEPMTIDDANYLPTDFVPEAASEIVDPFDSPDNPPSLSHSNLTSDVDTALAALSRMRLDDSQREALIASLNSSSDPTANLTSILPGLSSEDQQDSDALAAQTVISRMDQDQRRQLAAALARGAYSSSVGHDSAQLPP